MSFAGTPATLDFGSTFLITTAPAPTRASSPIIMLFIITAPVCTTAHLPIFTFPAVTTPGLIVEHTSNKL